MAAAVVSRGLDRVREWLSGRESGDAGGGAEAAGRAAALSSGQIGPQVVEGGPSVTYSEGGRYCKVFVPGQKGGPGGTRRAISQFSDKSRRALLKVVNSIDQRALSAGRVRLVTLTYPAAFPAARASKKHIKAMEKRFQRAWGRCPFIWKLEPQKRGAPHYHLLVFMESQDTLQSEVTWWAQNWYEVVGSGERNHLRWHLGQLGGGNEPCVQQIHSWNGVTSYAAKYLGKAFVADEHWHLPGRFWGVHCRECLPVKLSTVQLTFKQAGILRRACIRWYEHQPTGRYRWEWSVRKLNRNHVQRAFKSVSEVVAMREFGYEMRAYHRRWKWSKGGCSMFMPAASVERLLEWLLTGDRGRSETLVPEDLASQPAARVPADLVDVGVT